MIWRLITCNNTICDVTHMTYQLIVYLISLLARYIYRLLLVAEGRMTGTRVGWDNKVWDSDRLTMFWHFIAFWTDQTVGCRPLTPSSVHLEVKAVFTSRKTIHNQIDICFFFSWSSYWAFIVCKFSVLSNIAKLFSVVSDAVLSFYKLEQQVKNLILQKKKLGLFKNWKLPI